VLGHALIFCGKVGWLMQAIYSFHMPLMFSISGYVTAMTWERGERGTCEWARAGRKIVRSAKRLLLPYAFFALLVVPLVNAGIVGDIGAAFTTGWRNALVLNRSLWFLPCCFILVTVYMATRGLKRMRGLGRLKGFAGEVVSCVLSLVPIAILYLLFPQIDYFRSTLSYAFSFFAGVFIFNILSSRALSSLDSAVARSKVIPLVLTSALFLLAVFYFAFFPRPVLKPFIGLFSLLPLAVLAYRFSAWAPVSSVLSFVGQSTLVIYCLDFIATPLTIRWLAFLNRTGTLSVPLLVMLTFLYVPVAIAVFCFLRLAYIENLASKEASVSSVSK